MERMSCDFPRTGTAGRGARRTWLLAVLVAIAAVQVMAMAHIARQQVLQAQVRQASPVGEPAIAMPKQSEARVAAASRKREHRGDGAATKSPGAVVAALR